MGGWVDGWDVPRVAMQTEGRRVLLALSSFRSVEEEPRQARRREEVEERGGWKAGGEGGGEG